MEVTVRDDGLCRVGFSTPAARLDLGTDRFGFGFGGTGKKSNNRQFDDYGQVPCLASPHLTSPPVSPFFTERLVFDCCSDACILIEEGDRSECFSICSKGFLEGRRGRLLPRPGRQDDPLLEERRSVPQGVRRAS